MGSFDEYRDKWVYKCPYCGLDTYSYRDCGKVTPCRCGKDMQLVDFQEGKHVEEETTGHNFPNIITFKPYFDVTMNKEVTSNAEIKEYCKRNNMVYAGDKELTQQCEQNKRENEIRLDREITEGLTKTIMERL